MQRHIYRIEEVYKRNAHGEVDCRLQWFHDGVLASVTEPFAPGEVAFRREQLIRDLLGKDDAIEVQR